MSPASTVERAGTRSQPPSSYAGSDSAGPSPVATADVCIRHPGTVTELPAPIRYGERGRRGLFLRHRRPERGNDGYSEYDGRPPSATHARTVPRQRLSGKPLPTANH